MADSLPVSNRDNPAFVRHRRAASAPRAPLFDAIVFVAPLLSFVELNVIGRLYLTDFILVALLPILLFRHGRRLTTKLPRTFIGLLLLWLFGQVVSDIFRGTDFKDYARGWAMIFFTLLNFCTLYLLCAGKGRRLVLFTTGAAFGQLAGYLISPTAYSLGEPWKFGYGSGVSLLLVLCSIGMGQRLSSRALPAAMLLFVAALNIYMGYRSLGGIAFLAGCYTISQARHRLNSPAARARPRRIVALAVIAAVGTLGVLRSYEFAAQAGWLGASAQQKYDMQAAGDYGLLIGGRSEIMVSMRAVVESPLIGHGSWARDCRYAALYRELKTDAGYFVGGEADDCLIPTHSHVMGAWVQAGVLGAILWMWVLMLPARALAHLYRAYDPLTPLVALIALLLFWDILFSPFGGGRRFMTSFYIVLLMSYVPSGRSLPIYRSAPSAAPSAVVP